MNFNIIPLTPSIYFLFILQEITKMIIIFLAIYALALQIQFPLSLLPTQLNSLDSVLNNV